MARDADKLKRLGTEPVPRLLLSLSIPAILAAMVQALYGIVNSIYLAQLSEAALAAISLVFPVQILISAFAIGSGIGINSAISRRLGAERLSEADSAAGHGMLLGAIVTVLLGVAGAIFAEPFIGLFSQDAQISAQAVIYMRICCIFCFGNVFTQIGFSILQGSGQMVTPMMSQIIGCVLNVILAPILIFGWLGMPPAGIAGAAIATVLSQIVSMLIVFYFLLFSKKHAAVIRFARFRYNREIMVDILKVAAPAVAIQGIGTVMAALVNLMLAGFGSTAIAVYGAYYRLMSFVYLAVFGVSRGAMPLLGYSFGAKDKRRFTETVKYSMLATEAIMVVGLILFQLIPGPLLQLYNASDQMTAIGIVALRVCSLSFLLAGVSIPVTSAFSASGNSYLSMFSSFLRQLIVLIPACWALSQIGGLVGFWFGFVIADAVNCVFVLVMYKGFKQKHLDAWPAGPLRPSPEEVS